jgi:YVTN family beta-propeller protein
VAIDFWQATVNPPEHIMNLTRVMGRSLRTLFVVAAITAALQFSANHASAKSAGYLLVANKGDHTLGIIDVAAGKQIATVPEDGTTGHEVIASPDGKRAFVPIYGNSGVGHAGTDGSLLRVIDIAARKVVGTVDFGHGVRPHCAMFGPKDGLLYVSTELDNSITVIDPASLKILHAIPTGQTESHMFCISSDNKRIYTANVGPGTVSVLDVPSKKTIATIPIAKVTQRISISPDDKWVFTSDQTKPQLAVIDTSKNEVTKWVEMPGSGYGSAPTPDGKFLVIALSGKNKVAIIDLKTMLVSTTLDVPKAPQETLVRPDGEEAYVSCDSSKQIAVIDTKSWKVSKMIDAGPGADGLAWAKGE